MTIQRRTLLVLCIAQILGGLSMGASLALGSILGAELSGTDSLAGLPTTVLTLGAAAVGIPLGNLAQRHGRRPALATGLFTAAAGAAIVAAAVDLGWFLLLLAGMVALGSGTAVSLQARFAATDLSTPSTRGRDLSLVVWMTTIGAVTGPVLVSVGADLARALGLAELSGPFVIGSAAATLAGLLLVGALRPDPLHLSDAGGAATRPTKVSALATIRTNAGARRSLVTVTSAHAIMVAIMALTPVHMSNDGASLQLVGFSISAHLAGMYAFAPVMGMLADRVGRSRLAIAGQFTLLVACVIGVAAGNSHAGLLTTLVLLGLGWSAATVAASTLLTESVDDAVRPSIQGFSDASMSLAGAAAGALAGVIVGLWSYQVLAALAAAGAATVVGYLLRR